MSSPAIAGGPDRYPAPVSSTSQSSIYFSAAFGKEYSNFNNVDFRNALLDTTFSSNTLTFNTESNEYDHYLGRFSLGYNFRPWVGAEFGIFTSFTNQYNNTMSTNLAANHTIKFEYNISLYDFFAKFQYPLKSVPLIFFLKGGPSLIEIKTDYTNNNTSSSTLQSVNTSMEYIRPAFDLGVNYNFTRNSRYSNLIGFSWYHLFGSSNTTTANTNGSGGVANIRNLVKIPSINMWLLSYSIQINT